MVYKTEMIMDRKSFFKNVLLGIGAAIVPNVILLATRSKNPLETLKEVKTKYYYWQEYENNAIFDKFRVSINDRLMQIGYTPTIRRVPKDCRPYHLINNPNVLFEELVKKFKMRQNR